MGRVLTYHSKSFINQVMEDYFQSGMSQVDCAKKWKISRGTLNNWLLSCRDEKKSVSLPLNMSVMDTEGQELAKLQAENERLRRNLTFANLKVAAYERLMEIVKQEDGIDVLKKGGAKQ